jgi:hypothetical protein
MQVNFSEEAANIKSQQIIVKVLQVVVGSRVQ